MEYYNDGDYLPSSPQLEALQPTLTPSHPPQFVPLWQPQDEEGTPYSVYFGYDGDEIEMRRQLHYDLAPGPEQLRFRPSSQQFLGDVARQESLPQHRDERPIYKESAPDIEVGHKKLDSEIPLVGAGAIQSDEPAIIKSLNWVKTPNPSSVSSQGVIRAFNTPWVDAISRFHPPGFSPPGEPVLPKNLKKTRQGLPITLIREGVRATVLACADTGSDVNLISQDLAMSLGYTILPPTEKKELMLANGKIIQAIGHIESPCSFGIEAEQLISLTCIFHVLLRAATPIIIGATFLNDTKTMTEHRDRLVKVPRHAFQALSVCSVGGAREVLECALNYRETLAIADSGSELDLISSSFASERGLKIHPSEEIIEFADGSRAVTSGFVRATLSVKPRYMDKPLRPLPSTISVDLFVLEGLVHHVIVGEDSLEELEVHTNNNHALISVDAPDGPLAINRIRRIGSMDEIIAWFNKKFRRSSSSEAFPLANKPQVQPISPPGIGGFQCDFPGCTAAPFQTQYLLNSHANVHATSRPHFCTVAGCPRSEGGKGFKRKNEMIRHGLLHQSPGYVCPFCTERENKYPHPDNLARHVRVHHTDKRPDDPLLQEVLAQRPEVASRGRRRRVSP